MATVPALMTDVDVEHALAEWLTGDRALESPRGFCEPTGLSGPLGPVGRRMSPETARARVESSPIGRFGVEWEVREGPSFLGERAAAEEGDELPRGAICRFGERNEFSVHVAGTEEERLDCWRLVQKEYVSKGYAEPQNLECRYSVHDAVPDTATFMVEVDGALEGTVTVFPDSPLGLPADELYQRQIDVLRGPGHRPVEVGRLVIAREHTHNIALLVGLFDVLAMHARRLMRATHLVVTVNPSHAKYYERMLLFERIGREQAMPSVSGAPAVLLSLDLRMEEEMRQYARGEREKPDYFRGGRTFYAHTCSREEEDARVERIKRSRMALREDFLRRHFVRGRPLVPNLPASLRYFFEKCYPGYDLNGPRGLPIGGPAGRRLGVG